jgi:NAD(P)-dependent dehydrogenase (short-subunit alcohol dehydrogenase family)
MNNYQEKLSLEGRVAIVTGASVPRGIGKACCVALSQAGAKVVLTDRVAPGDEQAQAAIDSAVKDITDAGGEAVGIAVDVTSPEEITACVDRTMALYGRIDILVNNAGVTTGTGPFLDADLAQWQFAWDVNLMGIAYFSQATIPAMKEQGAGCIINTSSLAGLGARAGYGAYAATKHAVMGLTRTLADEFGEHGIRVLSINPGYIDTEMNDMQIEALAGLWQVTAAEARASMEGQTALRRFSDPAEIGTTVAFLASDAAGYITGVPTVIAGGLPAGL